jgi:hypothetical protein
MLSRFLATETRAKVANKCPNCGCTDKSTAHITRCRDEGQTQSFSESTTALMQCLGDQHTDPEVVHLFWRYLSGRGTRTMASLLGQPSRCCLAAEYHDQLGGDNFLEGQISALWVELRARNIHDRRLERNVDYWARGLMRQLLKMVHQQWLYRNATVHISLQDGLPRDKHDQILTRIEGCLGIDPGDLLEEDRVLLQVDFKRLARSLPQRSWNGLWGWALPWGRQSTSRAVLAMLCACGTAAVVGRGCV